MKDFSQEKWNKSLDKKDWSGLEDCNTVDEMVDIFIYEPLNDVAPYKTYLCI